MLRILTNLTRSALYLAMGGLVGYHGFDSGGMIGLLTNVFFFSLGILFVSSWQKSPKKQLGQLSVNPSLNEQTTDVNVVKNTDMTDKSQ